MDTLTGTSGDDEINALGGNDVIMGNAGADKLDGGTGTDTVDYSTSAAAVNVEVCFGTGIAGTGGDAEGSTLANIENVIGSASNDTFTVDPDHTAPAIRLEGGAGDDIYYINSSATPTIVEQAGGGNDEMRVSLVNPSHTYMAANIERLFVGTGAFTGWGNAGDNIITVVHGMADGGDGNDLLTGTGLGFSLFGGVGDDKLVLQASGSAFGGEGDDTYNVNTSALVTIQDDGASRFDKLVLSYISRAEPFLRLPSGYKNWRVSCTPPLISP